MPVTADASIEQTIKSYLIDKAGVAPELLESPQRKLSELALDSLSVIEMLFEVEDKYGVHVDDPIRLKEFDLAKLYQLIEQLIDDKSAATSATAVRNDAQPPAETVVSSGANA
jgi:acyl carrier protein